MKSSSLRSFDVFDTTLVRLWARPTDLFLQVGYELNRKGIVRFTPDEWVAYRTQAERMVASQNPKREIRLWEIYEEIGFLAGLDTKTLKAAAETECRLENQSLRVVPGIAKKIETARAEGHSIAFLSDIYLPGPNIRQWLEERGLATPDTAVYVSSDSGHRKHDGSLYAYFQKMEAVQTASWVHIGDNHHADVQRARGHQIAAEHFADSALNRYEKMIACDRALPPLERSLIAGASRLARLEGWHFYGQQKTIWETGASLIGPVFYGFVYWCLTTAHKRGLRRLYFVARDGQILHRIAEVICRQWKIPIETRYLYGSRQAWHLPSIDRFSESDFSWLFAVTEGFSLETIFLRLGMEPNNLRDLLLQAGFPEKDWKSPLQPKRIETLKKLMLEPAFRAEIEMRAAKARELAVSYLEQEGFFDGTPFGTVDIGWYGNMQRSLARMITRANRTLCEGFAGFYLHIQPAGGLRPDEIMLSYLPLHQEGLPNRLVVGPLEILAAATHGGTMGYQRLGDKTLPHLTAEVDSGMSKWGIDRQQDAALRFAHLLGSSLESFGLKPLYMRECSRFLLECFTRKPSKAEAVAYGPVLINSDQASERAYPLAPVMNLRQALFYAIWGIRGTRERWTEGVAARSSRWPGRLLAARLYLRKFAQQMRNF